MKVRGQDSSEPKKDSVSDMKVVLLRKKRKTEVKVLSATSSQTRMNTVPFILKQNLFNTPSTEVQNPIFQFGSKASNDSSTYSEDKELLDLTWGLHKGSKKPWWYEEYMEFDCPFEPNIEPRRKIKFSQKDQRFMQNRNLGLASWLKAYCDIPHNVCSLKDKEKHIRNSAISQACRKLRGDPRIMDDRSSKYQVIDWDRVSPKPVEGWHGYRSPTVVQLIEKAYKQGYHFVTKLSYVFNGYHESTGLEKFEDSRFVLFEDDVEEVLPLPKPEDVSIPLYAGSCYYDSFKDQTDRHRYLKWLESQARGKITLWCWESFFAHKVKYVNTSLKYNAVSSEDIEAYSSYLSLKEAYSSYLSLKEEIKYFSWLEKYEILNPHIDYTPSVISKINNRYVYLDTRYLTGRDLFPAARNGSFGCDVSLRNDLWLRFVSYIHDYESGHITGEELKKIGDILYSKPVRNFNNWVRAVDVLLNRKSKENKVKSVRLKALKRFESNREEAAIKCCLQLNHPSGHSHDQVFSFVMKKGIKAFKETTAGLFVPDSYDENLGHCVIQLDRKVVGTD